MSSRGGAVLGIVGAIAGAYFGVPGLAAAGWQGGLYGAQIGIMVGGIIDPPKGPKQAGPKLQDLSVQVATYGRELPRVYGKITVSGCVVWVKQDRLQYVKKKTSGGKGGGGATTVSYTYYSTFAVALAVRTDAPIAGLARLWFGPNLVYDGTATTSAAVVQSGKRKASWTLYTGSDTQQPDPEYQADKAAANCSGWPGEVYMVFRNINLEKYGNSLAGLQVTAELVTSGTSAWSTVGSMTMTGLYSTNSAFTGFCSHFTDQGGYYFEPLWNNNYNQWPYTLRVWYIGVDLSQKLVGTVSTSVSSGTAVTCSASLDIQACAIRFESGGAGYSLGILSKDGTLKLFQLPAGNGFSQVLVRKRGDDLIVTSYIGSPIRRYSYSTTVLEAITSAPATDWVAVDVFEDEVYAVDATGAVSIFDKSTLTLSVTIPSPGTYSVTGSSRLCVTGSREFYLSIETYYWRYENSAYSLLFAATDGYESQHALFAIGTTLVSAEALTTKVYGQPITQNSVYLDDVVQAEILQSNLLTAGDLDLTALASDTVRGYRVAGRGSIRNNVEPLQQAFPFDLRMHGYQLQAVRRGGASVATIPWQDLDARPAGEASGTMLAIPRDMDTQLPQRVRLKYLDADREYDTGEQVAQRFNTDARETVDLELPLVMTATEAARASEVLLYTWWRERGADIAFSLPPTYLHLEPADVVTINAQDGSSHVLRLTSIHYTADGRLECTARYEYPAGYTSTAVADTGSSNGSGMVIQGPSIDVLMDLPALTADGNTPGFYAAMTGMYPDWQGGILYASYDSGQNWDDLAAFPDSSVIGTVAAAPSNPLCYDMVDASGTMSVTLYDGELASVTELQLLAGANHFAYGRHGRWEIIAAKTATLTGTLTYTLQDFIRGRFGTEQFSTQHQAGDLLVLLDTTATQFLGRTTAHIDAAGEYRAVTVDADLEDVSSEAFTYTGENLMPRSPIALNGNRHPSTNDWTLTWTRRARINTEWRDYVDVAMDEASEAYEVEIYSSGAYTTLKRTLTGLSSATAAYTSAQQVADFGSNQATLYVKVYQLSATVGRGWPLITSITR